MDKLSREVRSKLMSRIGRQHTAPELAVRNILSEFGMRYRLHGKGLIGRPDIFNRSRNFAIFVHGCFWHNHSCKRGTRPASNRSFWDEKLTRNKSRDRAAVRELQKEGWNVLTIWECQTKDRKGLKLRLQKWLEKLSERS